MVDMAYQNGKKLKGLCIKCGEKSITRGFCLYHYFMQLKYDRDYNARNRAERNKAQSDRRKRYINERRCGECGVELIEGEGNRCINCQTFRSTPKGVFNETNNSSTTRQPQYISLWGQARRVSS